VVTFGNGMEVREPIVDLDDAARRLVWSAVGAGLTHYNSVQVLSGPAEVVGRMDCRPSAARQKGSVDSMMEQIMAIMGRPGQIEYLE
jgi:hypothetical protein